MKEIHENALCYIGRRKVKECQKAIHEFASDTKKQNEIITSLRERRYQWYTIYSFGTNCVIDDDEFDVIAKTITENQVKGLVIYVSTTAATVLEYDTTRTEKTPYRVRRNIHPSVVVRLETAEERGLRERLEERLNAANEAKEGQIRCDIEQIVRYLNKNDAYKTMVELMLPKRLHTAFKRVLEEFASKE